MGEILKFSQGGRHRMNLSDADTWNQQAPINEANGDGGCCDVTMAPAPLPPPSPRPISGWFHLEPMSDSHRPAEIDEPQMGIFNPPTPPLPPASPRCLFRDVDDVTATSFLLPCHKRIIPAEMKMSQTKETAMGTMMMMGNGGHVGFHYGRRACIDGLMAASESLCHAMCLNWERKLLISSHDQPLRPGTSR